ncbi:MAG: aldo/keto reductase [Candidatus Heimdallarchaeaceae archaeon]|jgi:aryl-alcohol dehydrogenase-like predicted oxidoreductase
MEYTKLGSTGIKISKLILGTMQFGWRVEEEGSFKVMDKAIELGINCFDTANVYSRWAENSYPGKSEEIIGRWLKDRDTRENLILATKLRGSMSDDINAKGLSRRHVRQAIAASLKRLQTDWIDLYQIHSFDDETPIEETLHALNILIDEGKVNYLGTSNIHPWMLVESFWVSDKYGYARFETVQPPYSIVRRLLVENQMLDVIKQFGLGVIPYSPLAGGFLTERYSREGPLPDTPRSEGAQRRYFTEKRWKIHETVREIADSKEVKMTQIAIAWILTKDFITAPIVGANDPNQLEENITALEIKLDEDEIKRLDEVSDWVSDYESIR